MMSLVSCQNSPSGVETAGMNASPVFSKISPRFARFSSMKSCLYRIATRAFAEKYETSKPCRT